MKNYILLAMVALFMGFLIQTFEEKKERSAAALQLVPAKTISNKMEADSRLIEIQFNTLSEELKSANLWLRVWASVAIIVSVIGLFFFMLASMAYQKKSDQLNQAVYLLNTMAKSKGLSIVKKEN